jgi:hypothetical protein
MNVTITNMRALRLSILKPSCRTVPRSGSRIAGAVRRVSNYGDDAQPVEMAFPGRLARVLPATLDVGQLAFLLLEALVQLVPLLGFHRLGLFGLQLVHGHLQTANACLELALLGREADEADRG